ncbi:MAG: lipopolysaccharide assembly protein LapA domain-containing protein [Solirubrobacterales bacterium]
MQIWFIISLVFSLIIALFAALNSDVVTIRLIFAKYQLSQSLVIILSAAIGAIIAIFLGLFSKIKTKLKIRELNNEIKAANAKIAELKAALDKKEGEALTTPKVNEVKK